MKKNLLIAFLLGVLTMQAALATRIDGWINGKWYPGPFEAIGDVASQLTSRIEKLEKQ